MSRRLLDAMLAYALERRPEDVPEIRRRIVEWELNEAMCAEIRAEWLGDYLLCNTPIPPGVVRVRCMNCGADGTITAAGALELAKAKARGAELAGAICRRCALEILPPAADAGRIIHLTASPQGEELLKRSENAKALAAEILRNPGARRE